MAQAALQKALETESTLTDRFQTTVPSVVRQALHLEKKDKIKYVIQPNGDVLITRAIEAEETDPVMDSFLSFIADDMRKHPEKIQPLSVSVCERIDSLIPDMSLDLDAALSDEDE